MADAADVTEVRCSNIKDSCNIKKHNISGQGQCYRKSSYGKIVRPDNCSLRTCFYREIIIFLAAIS